MLGDLEKHVPQQARLSLCHLVAAVGIVVGALLLLLLASSYLAQAPPRDPHRFASWDVPGFAGYNNQMLMLATAPIYQPVAVRTMVASDITFLPVQGLRKPRRVPVDDIFEPFPLRKYYAPRPVNVAPTTVPTLADLRRLADAPFLVYGAADSEDYWAYIYARFIVFGVLLRSAAIYDVMQSFVYRDPVRTLVDAALANVTRHSVRDAIGVHIRTFDHTAAKIGGDVCQAAPWYHPFRYYFKCAVDAADLARYIDAYDAAKPIYVAVDDPEHRIVADLTARYGDRVFFLRDVLDLGAYAAPADGPIPPEAICAIVENELLRHTDAFVGNIWSTYSAVAAVKRRFRRSEFVLFAHVQWVGGGALLAAGVVLARLLWRSMRGPATRGYSRLDRSAKRYDESALRQALSSNPC